MRLFVYTLAIILGTGFQTTAYGRDNNEIFCTKLGELAGRAMAARLQGKPVTELLVLKFDPAVHDIFQGIIKEAYLRPLAQGEDAWVKNMSDFRNDVEEHCRTTLQK